MESLNRMALELVDEALEFADELAADAFELDNGATVIDLGVEAVGGIEAGLLLAEIQTGGLATVTTRAGEVAGAPIPHVELHTDHPALSLLCAQKAGWDSFETYEGLGSGPARALVAEEEEFARLGYREDGEFAVLCLESERLPDEAVAAEVAELCGVDPGSTFLPTFATDSVAGSVTLAARAGELAAFRLSELGYDLRALLTVHGSAPVAPVAGDYETAVGRTNDALAYGGRVHATIEEEFDRLDETVSSAASAHGEPFVEIFEAADWTFADVPVELFAPAQVTYDVVGGPTRVVGHTEEETLAASFGLA
jgi:methenyltetrahydromethanopterin cyclohydrolase